MATYPPLYPPFYPESATLTGAEQRVTVSTAAVSLTPNAVGSPGRRVVIRNTNTPAADTLSLGGPQVTAADGFLLAGGGQLAVPLSPGDDLWAVRGAAADVDVHILRFGPQ